MKPKKEGPFEIEEVLGKLVYKLKLPTRWRIHPVFHASLLKPFNETEAHGPNFLEPPAELIDGEEHYEIEAIVDHRKRGRWTQYLVKWKDYSSADNSWETESNLKSAKKTLDDYKRRKNLL